MNHPILYAETLKNESIKLDPNNLKLYIKTKEESEYKEKNILEDITIEDRQTDKIEKIFEYYEFSGVDKLVLTVWQEAEKGLYELKHYWITKYQFFLNENFNSN